MKLFARLFALALVATGAVASAHIANASQPVTVARASALPVPSCDPNAPGSCGMFTGR